MAKNLYKAKETIFLPGRQVVVAGTMVDEKDERRKGREHLFERVLYIGESEVEQATKAPGEKRAAKKPAAKKGE